MKKTFRRLIALTAAAAMLPVSGFIGVSAASRMSRADVIVRLDPADASPFNNGRFEGWGTSMGWWGNRIGYSDKLAEDSARLFYDEETGLGLDIVRYNVGGGDDPSHNHITRSDSKLPCLMNSDGTYDWDADYNQTNVLKKIKEENDNVHIEGYTNSPPWFMTKSGCSGGGTNAGENLDPSKYGEFAEFVADVTEHYKEIGLPFSSYSPMNEPDPSTKYWGANSPKQEGNHVAVGANQSALLAALSDEYKSRGIDTIVAGMDETSIDLSINSYNKLTDEGKAALGRFDTHTYGGSKRAELKQLAIESGKTLWMSEVDNGGTAGTNAGNMGAGLNLANNILTDMNGMQPAAWVMWDILDFHKDSTFEDPSGNYTEKDNALNQNGGIWGVGMVNHDTQEIELTQKYYVYGQFSRYINPGDTVIASSDKTLAAYNKDTGTIKIVAVNTDDTDRTYDFDLGAFKSVGDTAKVIRTSGSMDDGEHWAELDDIKLNGKTLSCTLIPNSVTTFVVENNVKDVDYISINGARTVVMGSTAQYTASASDGSDIVWSVSDESVASITQDGALTPISEGETVVTAKSESLGYESDFEIRVLNIRKLDITPYDGSSSWNNDASSNYQKAADGDLSTYFDGLNAGYVTLDLGGEYEIGGIGYAPRSGFEYRMQGGSFYGSADGETWTKLYTISVKPSANVLTYVYSDDIANKYDAYRYIKYAVPSGKQSFNGKEEDYNCNVAEIEIYAAGAEEDPFAKALAAIRPAGEIYGNINMPSEYGDVKIEWTSSDESIIAKTGEVTRGDENKSVTLGAVLTAGDESIEQKYDVTVIKKAEGKSEDDMKAYLFVHFVGTESNASQEQIYFSVSEDGTTWQTLNMGAPVLTSEVGEGGVRDPHIIRSPEGDKFFLIATDLSIYNRRDDSNRWGTCQTSGSRSIVIWESNDLVSWSKARLVKVAPDNAGCTWAPESIYDDASGRYMVFWASKTADDNYTTQRIYRAYTRDFVNFTEPEIYMDGGSISNIDTTFLKDNGVYYRFTKNESKSSVIMERSADLDGEFEAVDTYTINGTAGNSVTGYEGPTAYKINGENKWCLLLDYYSKSQGYKPFVTDDISKGTFTSAADFSFDTKYRHGTVMPITAEEYRNLMEAYTEQEVPENGEIIFDMDFDGSDLTAKVGSAESESTTLTYEDGIKGKAAVLDGKSFIKIASTDGASLLDGLDRFTVSFWSKTSGKTSWWFYAAPDERTQTYESEKYAGILDNGSSLTAERYNSSSMARPSAATASYTSGEWKHVALVHKNNSFALYVDGEKKSEVATAVDISDMLGENSIAYIGKANWGSSGEYAVGSVDEFRIYNAALTADEVAREYHRMWFENVTVSDGKLEYTLKTAVEAPEKSVYTALYDGDGTLVDVKITQLGSDLASVGTFELPAGGTYTVSAYLWDANQGPAADGVSQSVEYSA